jgi:hypothetical protein
MPAAAFMSSGKRRMRVIEGLTEKRSVVLPLKLDLLRRFVNHGQGKGVAGGPMADDYCRWSCEVASQSQILQMYGKRISDFAVLTLWSGTLYIKYY